MSVLMFFLIWYAIGAVMSVIMVAYDHYHGYDITLSEFLMLAICPLLGPIWVVIAMTIFAKDNDMVLLKGRKKKND